MTADTSVLWVPATANRDHVGKLCACLSPPGKKVEPEMGGGSDSRSNSFDVIVGCRYLCQVSRCFSFVFMPQASWSLITVGLDMLINARLSLG